MLITYLLTFVNGILFVLSITTKSSNILYGLPLPHSTNIALNASGTFTSVLKFDNEDFMIKNYCFDKSTILKSGLSKRCDTKYRKIFYGS